MPKGGGLYDLYAGGKVIVANSSAGPIMYVQTTGNTTSGDTFRMYGRLADFRYLA